MKNPMISIIIPVYNAEKYISTCLDSVVNQTYRDIEVVIVNDGSLDNSLNIIEKYSNNDSRIKVYTKDNGGVSSSRNYGLNKANGEYILFVDSDDYLASNTVLQGLILGLNESDVLYFKTLNQKSSITTENKVDNLSSTYETGIDFLNDALKDNFGWYLWRYLFKKELWNGISFPENRIFEDAYTIYQVLLRSKKISVINENIYIYRYNEVSLSKRINAKVCDDMLFCISNSIKTIESLNINSHTKELLQNNFAYSYISVVNALYIIHKKDRKSVKILLEDNKRVLNYCKYGSLKKVKLVIDIFGINGTALLLYLRRMIKNLL